VLDHLAKRITSSEWWNGRMGIRWFAAKHQNWDLAAFEAREAKGVQRGAVRSNQSRQQGIDAYNSAFLDPLIAAAQSRDQTQFEASYVNAIDGCNACHASQNQDGSTANDGRTIAVLRSGPPGPMSGHCRSGCPPDTGRPA
jgi:hypothetical protein